MVGAIDEGDNVSPVSRYRREIISELLLVGLLALAACAPSVAGNPSTPTTPVATAFCQQNLSIAEVNQLMQPPTTATTIRVDKGPAGGGTCK